MTDNPVERILQHFDCEHLDGDIRPISRECQELAQWMYENLPVDAETVAGMRKLLEAKDCFVRAKVVELKNIRFEYDPFNRF